MCDFVLFPVLNNANLGRTLMCNSLKRMVGESVDAQTDLDRQRPRVRDFSRHPGSVRSGTILKASVYRP
jgi:hypothetical protein